MREKNTSSKNNLYETLLRFKDEEIERYKDFKTKLSTKMVSESLEQHCEIEFNKLSAECIDAEIYQYEECLNLK